VTNAFISAGHMPSLIIKVCIANKFTFQIKIYV
jgi:hypothetical protein